MKCLLLVVIAAAALSVRAEDTEFEDDLEVNKRNSELLNSLLALPGGIHRSGKYVYKKAFMACLSHTLSGCYDH